MNVQEIEPRVAPNQNGDVSRPRVTPPRAGRWLALAMVGVAVIAGVWAYGANARSGPAMDMSQHVAFGNTPFPVTVETAVRGPIVGTVVYTGSVAPFTEEDIYPRVTGRIVEMPVYPGDRVRAGQVIARLDSVELSSRVTEAEANLAMAQAGRAQMEAELIAAGRSIAQMERELAMVEAELTYARQTLSRTERLVGIGVVARQEYDRDVSKASSTEARREAAAARLEQARAMETAARKKLEAAESAVAQAQAAARTAAVVRDYATIQAPSDGYVVKRLVAPGVLAQPGTAVLKLTQIDRVRLQANVGEKDLPGIKVGGRVAVATTTGGTAVDVRVTSVFPFVDAGARTAVVEAVIDNVERRFLPGQYVTMRFVTGERPDAITVARGAVARLGGKATVWVVSEDRAEPHAVVTGLEGPERIEIVTGLSERERVVARGHEALYAGARIADVSAGPVSAQPPGDTPGTEAKAKGGAHGGH